MQQILFGITYEKVNGIGYRKKGFVSDAVAAIRKVHKMETETSQLPPRQVRRP